jgi:hypothetical protein
MIIAQHDRGRKGDKSREGGDERLGWTVPPNTEGHLGKVWGFL